MTLRVFIIAGEASGDKLGAALMAGLQSLSNVEFNGVGGAGMIARGLTSLFPMEDMSVMGIVEILRSYRFLKSRVDQTIAAALAWQPDVLITIDAPEFGLRVARAVKSEATHIRTVHYVAPSVWAWRPKRAQKMAAYIDQVLALLPFEPPYMQAAGMRCDFVGHPVVTDPMASAEEVEQFRQLFSDSLGKTILLLPGSRKSEVTRLLPIFAQVVDKMGDGYRYVLPMAPAVVDFVRTETQGWRIKPILLSPDDPAYGAHKRASFALADVALAASGTVSLELAAARTPMVIAYDMGWLSRQIIGRMVKVDTVTLVNLVTDTRTVPEFIGKNCTADLIAPALKSVLDHPDDQIAALDATMEALGKFGEDPGLRAARAVLSGLQ